MSIIRLIAVLALIFSVGCVSAEQTVWRYVDLTSIESLGTVEISADNYEISYSGHIAFDWVGCDENKKKYAICFESPRLIMKLPHDALDVKSWTEDGTRFSAQLHREVLLFGQAVGDIYVVSREGQEKQGYVYSPDRGVVAVFLSGAGSYSIVLIDGKCGYGAPKRCYVD